jgi:hypothetical protein
MAKKRRFPRKMLNKSRVSRAKKPIFGLFRLIVTLWQQYGRKLQHSLRLT